MAVKKSRKPQFQSLSKRYTLYNLKIFFNLQRGRRNAGSIKLDAT
jgi:hypothetical protein